MSKRYPKAKWPLPAVVDPSQRLCVKVYVPNDEAHIAAFRGALLALQSAYNWQDDEAHTAKDVALVWREIIREMGTNWGCGIDTIEFRQSTSCGLEVSIDGGAWTPIYNGYNCALQAIADSVDNGGIAAPGQQAPGGTIPASSCETYNITLRANSRWRAPNPVEAGYTVQVAAARGDWSDTNGIIALWYCPDGLYSALGTCGGIPITYPVTIAIHLSSSGINKARQTRLPGRVSGVR